jgi:hypothetical protein
MHVPSRLIIYSNAGHWPSWYEMALDYTAHLEWFHQYLGADAAPWGSDEFLRNASSIPQPASAINKVPRRFVGKAYINS